MQQPATVVPPADGADVLLARPALAAPGQACVFYDGDRVLGGGFIRAALVDAGLSEAVCPAPSRAAARAGTDGGVAQR